MRIKEGFEKTEVDGDIIVVPVADDGFHGIIRLNETAAEIWDMINECQTTENIISRLAAKYTESDTDSIREYVEEFTGKLRSVGVLDD